MSFMKKGVFLTIILLSIGFAQDSKIEAKIRSVIQEKIKNAKESHPLLGKQFSEFKFRTLKGKSISSEKLKDKVVVLNAWFLACKPCIMEMPDLNNIVNDYKNKDVEFLAITFDKKRDVRKFLRKTDFNYRHITDQMNFMQENEIFAYPTHLVIDKSGKLVKAIVGLSLPFDEELRHAIDDALDH